MAKTKGSLAQQTEKVQMKIRDATADDGKKYLAITPAELEHQQDLFSRTLDPKHWVNVVAV